MGVSGQPARTSKDGVSNGVKALLSPGNRSPPHSFFGALARQVFVANPLVSIVTGVRDATG